MRERLAEGIAALCAKAIATTCQERDASFTGIAVDSGQAKEAEMRVEHHPWTYDLDARFPHQRHVFGYEGGHISAAEAEGKFCLIIDERTMADFLIPDDPTDAEVLASLEAIIEFDTAGERDSKLAEMIADHHAARRRMHTG